MVRFGIIGIGRMGKRHAINLAYGFARGIRLAAVCDISDEALGFCKRFFKKVARYTDYKAMIDKENLDCVLIATEHMSHAEIAKYAISKGVHTLIEKPSAVTSSECDSIIETAAKYPDVKVGVSFNQRSNRLYNKAKKLLSSGKLGEIQRVDFVITDWYRSQAYYNQGGWRASYNGEGGGCLINQCVHQLDILQWLIGMPDKVFAKCRTVNRNITVENDVSAILTYKDYNCMFSASSHELKGTNRLEIACDKGKIVITPWLMRVWTHKSETTVNATTNFGYGFAPSFKKVFSYGLWRGFVDLVLGQQLRSIKAFAKEVSGKGKMLSGIADGSKAVELINAIYLSSWKKEEVELPINQKEYNSLFLEKQEKERKE